MNRRVLAATAAALLLLMAVLGGQWFLNRSGQVLTELAEQTREAFSAGETEKGKQLLADLSSELESRRFFLSLLVNNSRIHELDRAISRAENLCIMGETSLVLEELADLSEALSDLSAVFRVSAENILKCRFSVANAA